MIGPGIANPMLWGGTDPLDDIAKVERSLRLRRGASARLSRAFSIPTNEETWTLHFWIKLGQLAVTFDVFSDNVGSGSDRATIGFNSTGQLVLNDYNTGAQQALLSSQALCRDGSSHFAVTIHMDCSNATPADRVRVYLEDTRIAMSGTMYATITSNNFNKPRTHTIGGGISGFADCCLSNFVFVDGKNLQPSAFAMRHPRTGQWRPRSKTAIREAVALGGGARNGWGINGFFLPFDSVGSLASLGYDLSQSDLDTSGNNWTATNISLTPGENYDSSLDTPTSNFWGMNSGYVKPSVYSVSNGGHTVSYSGATVQRLFLGVQIPSKGKWYAEVKKTGGLYLGVYYGYVGLYNARSEFLYYPESGQSPADNRIYQIAIDMDAGKVWIGVAINTADVEAGANPTGTFIPGEPIFPMVDSAWNHPFVAHWNFGQRAFDKTVPSGYKALTTKNLPIEPQLIRPSDSFAAVTDSGASVAIALAAQANWPDWIRMYKRRDASEGWRWQFSDDQGNFLDTAGTAAKAPFPALSGSSYIGYALKVSAANGVATGRLTHVNGVADVVLDGLGKSRKVVILKSEATGNWVFYHPDLTPGKLLFLNSVQPEAVDASISAVTESGFTVLASLPSGTYRWVSIAETSGFISMGKYTGNGSADGPINHADSPALTITHIALGGTSGWGVIDSVRDKANPSGSCVSFESASAEVTGTNYLDQLSNGFKLRQSAYNANSAGQGQIFLSIAKHPFRYANAR